MSAIARQSPAAADAISNLEESGNGKLASTTLDTFALLPPSVSVVVGVLLIVTGK